MLDARSRATSPASSGEACSTAGLLTGARREPRPPAVGRAGSRSRPRALDTSRGHALRRQPAEGRARQVAGRPSRELLIVDEPTRGIDVGTKAEVHRLLSELAGRGHRDPDDLLRAARGARHGRPGAGHAARAGSPPSSPAAEATAEAVMFAATHQRTHDGTTRRRADRPRVDAPRRAELERRSRAPCRQRAAARARARHPARARRRWSSSTTVNNPGSCSAQRLPRPAARRRRSCCSSRSGRRSSSSPATSTSRSARCSGSPRSSPGAVHRPPGHADRRRRRSPACSLGARARR